MAVTIRPAAERDLLALQAIEVAADGRFQAIGMDAIADNDPASIEELRDATALLVAVDGADQPVGYAWVELVDGHAHLEQLSVLPRVGGQGIGTALLDAVAAWARQRGDREITLTTFRDVPFNAPLYAKRGYEVVPEDGWTAELRTIVDGGVAFGLDPAQRVVMRRRLSGPG